MCVREEWRYCRRVQKGGHVFSPVIYRSVVATMKDVIIDVAEEHSDNGARRVKLHLAFVSDLPSAGCKYNVRESDCSKDVNVRIAMAKRKKCELTTLWKDRSIPVALSREDRSRWKEIVSQLMVANDPT